MFYIVQMNHPNRYWCGKSREFKICADHTAIKALAKGWKTERAANRKGLELVSEYGLQLKTVEIDETTLNYNSRIEADRKRLIKEILELNPYLNKKKLEEAAKEEGNMRLTGIRNVLRDVDDICREFSA